MKNLKINQIEKDAMSKKEMQQLTGGIRVCLCGCIYADTPGGSSTNANGSANVYIGVEGGRTPGLHVSEQEIFW